MTPVEVSEIAGRDFTLLPWTEDEADRMIHQVDSWLEAIGQERDYHTAYGQGEWDRLHGALALAEGEALLRFPGSSRAEIWRWDRCHNLALSSGFAEGPEAPEFQCYESLLVPALDQQATTAVDLTAWFSLHERRIGMTVTELEPPREVDAAWLVQMGGEGFDAQAYMLLLRGPEGFQLQGLISYLYYLREADSRPTVVDLTGDGFPELVVSYAVAYCCGVISDNYVFSFEQTPARRLRIVGTEGESNSIAHLDSGELVPLQDSGEGPGFVFVTSPSGFRGPCDFLRRELYLWNGIAFELTETQYETSPPRIYQDARFCDDVFSLIRDPAEVVVAAHVFAYLQPPLDELRYRLAEDRARRGEVDLAMDGFTTLVANPDDFLDPSYLDAAESFIAGYRSVQDYYTVCGRAQVCDAQAALRSAADRIPAEAYPAALDLLREEGVPILAEGVFDFDGDGVYDQWAVVRHPGQSNLEFWALVNGADGPQALYVADSATTTPRLEYAERRGLPRVVILDRSHAFRVTWTSGTAHILATDTVAYDPTTSHCHQLNRATARDLANQLIGGGDPSTVATWLLGLAGPACAEFGDLTDSDSYYYSLGLAYELAGNEQAAIEAYLELWRRFPSSPYTIMARSKLTEGP
jgi:tetratricopeptide (TPR) repeat protein